MVFLALDTTGKNCKIGLRKNGEDFYKIAPAERRQTEVIFPLLDELLKSANVEKKEINSVVVPVGPGSFTGVRLATTISRAIATALGANSVGISSIEALAVSAARMSGHSKIAVATDAKRDQVYFGAYSFEGTTDISTTVIRERISYPRDVEPFEKNDWATAGDGWTRYGGQFPDAWEFCIDTSIYEIEISDILQMGEKKVAKNKKESVEPNYLRHPVEKKT